MPSLTNNSRSGSLLTFCKQVFTTKNMQVRWGFFSLLLFIFPSFGIVYSLSDSYFCSRIHFNALNLMLLFSAVDQPNGAKL